MKHFLFFFCLFPFWTEALNVSTSVDKKTLALNESLIFTIQIQSEGEKIKKLDIPDLSDLNGFYVLDQSQGQQSSINIVNGKMTSTKTILYNYSLQPRKTGLSKIPALKIKVNGQTFQTESISITVTKQSNKPSTPPQSSPFTLPFSFQMPHSLFNIPNPLLNNRQKAKIKLHVNLSKNSVYKTEIVRADWLILQSSRSVNYGLHETPSFEGFWKEEIKNKTKDAGTQVIDKVLYKKIFFNSLWLFPLKTGELVIDPYVIKLHYLSMFSQGEAKAFPKKIIKVKELPSNGRDNSFTGAVGSFKMKAEIKDKSAKVNHPVSYKLTFKGAGHPRFINLPPLSFPSSVQVYPPAEKSQFSDSLGQGIKEFEFLIIPKQEGVLNIPSFTLSTFDPNSGQYVFHKTPSFSIPVQKGKADDEEGISFLEEEQDQQNALLFEPLQKTYWPQFISHKNFMMFWLFFFSSSLIGLFFLHIKDFNLFKRKKSVRKKINRKFKIIQKLLDKKDWQKACIQMIRVNYMVLYSSQIKSSTPDWRQALKDLPPSLNKKYASQFETLFKKLEFLSFGPGPQVKMNKSALSEAQKLFKHTKTLINSLLLDMKPS